MSTQRSYDDDDDNRIETDDISEFLSGGIGARAFKFLHHGDCCKGIICEPPKMMQRRDFQTKVPLTWEDGRPRMELTVVAATDIIADENHDGRWALFITGGKRNALIAACKKAGVSRPYIGDEISMTYTGDAIPTGGRNPAKVFAATISPVVN